MSRIPQVEPIRSPETVEGVDTVAAVPLGSSVLLKAGLGASLDGSDPLGEGAGLAEAR